MLSFSSDYTIFLSFFYFLIALLYAFILYKDERRGSNKKLIRILFILRTVFVLGICFLLLNPYIKSFQRHTLKPIIVIAQDVSSSIEGFGIYDELNNLSLDLKKDFEVFPFHFDDDLYPGLSNKNIGKTTNYNKIINNIYNQFSNENVCAIVFASDGLYNSGSNPKYNNKMQSIPFFTIALGDTNSYKDLSINKVTHNQSALLSNRFSIDVMIESYKYRKKNVEVQLLHNNELIDSKMIKINSDSEFRKIRLWANADKKGVQSYVVNLKSDSEELTKQNNTYTTYVDIRDSRSNVLILTSSPHPDIAAYKSAIDKYNYYNIESYNVDEYIGDFSKYDLIVISGIESQEVIDRIKKTKASILIFSRGDFLKYSSLYPINLKEDFQTKNESSLIADTTSFLFSFSDDLKDLIQNSPPVFSRISNPVFLTTPDVVLWSINANTERRTPSVIIDQSIERKIGVLFSEGFWKMKLHDYRINRNNLSFDELFSKITQLLILDNKKEKFRIIHQNEIDENIDVVIQAEIYNDSYKKISDRIVDLKLIDEMGKEYFYTFTNQNNNYILNLGKIKQGRYTYIANINGSNIKKEGGFTVKSIQLEQLSVTADHSLLEFMASSTNGKIVFPNNINKLKSFITDNKCNSVIHFEEKSIGLINIYWILLSLLSLLAIEWILRKYNGLI